MEMACRVRKFCRGVDEEGSDGVSLAVRLDRRLPGLFRSDSIPYFIFLFCSFLVFPHHHLVHCCKGTRRTIRQMRKKRTISSRGSSFGGSTGRGRRREEEKEDCPRRR